MSQTKSMATLTRLNQLTCLVPRLTPHRSMASQGDQEVSKFLIDEISTEKKNARALPKLDGWNVATDGAEVTLTRELKGEKVMVTLNVNHTVDSAEPDDGSEEVVGVDMSEKALLSHFNFRLLKCSLAQILK